MSSSSFSVHDLNRFIKKEKEIEKLDNNIENTKPEVQVQVHPTNTTDLKKPDSVSEDVDEAAAVVVSSPATHLKQQPSTSKLRPSLYHTQKESQTMFSSSGPNNINSPTNNNHSNRNTYINSEDESDHNHSEAESGDEGGHENEPSMLRTSSTVIDRDLVSINANLNVSTKEESKNNNKKTRRLNKQTSDSKAKTILTHPMVSRHCKACGSPTHTERHSNSSKWYTYTTYYILTSCLC